MLADFLPWAAIVGPGVVLNKDGSFQRTARFRGPISIRQRLRELVGTTARLNNALRRLGSGWAIFVEKRPPCSTRLSAGPVRGCGFYAGGCRTPCSFEQEGRISTRISDFCLVAAERSISR